MQLQVGILRKDMGLLSGFLTIPSVGIFPLCRVNISANGKIREVRHCLHYSSIATSLLSQLWECRLCLTQRFGTWQRTKMCPRPQNTVLGDCVLSKQGGAGSFCLLEVLIVIKLGGKAPKKWCCQVALSRRGSAGRPMLCAEDGECRSCGEMEIMKKWPKNGRYPSGCLDIGMALKSLLWWAPLGHGL